MPTIPPVPSTNERLTQEHNEDDLGFAAFLVVKGFKLLGLAPGSRGHYSFWFDDSAGGAKENVMSHLHG